MENDNYRRFSFLFEGVKDNMGFVPNSMKRMASVPGLLGGFSILSGLLLTDPKKAKPSLFFKLILRQIGWAAKLMRSKDRLSLELRHMVAYLTSKSAGCMYCQAHTFNSIKNSEVSESKLLEIWNFESSSQFTDSEKAAFRFAIAAGEHPNGVTKGHFEDLQKYFSEEQIVELGAIVSLFGFLNRWNETFSTQLESEPLAIANKYLKNQGWNGDRHM